MLKTKEELMNMTKEELKDHYDEASRDPIFILTVAPKDYLKTCLDILESK